MDEFAIFILLSVTSFFTSLITAAIGIGGGTLMLAMMAQVLPIAAVVPVHGVVQLGSNSGRALIMMKQIQRHALTWFGVGSVLGATFGGLVVIEIPHHLLSAILGAFILISIWMPKLHTGDPSAKTLFAVGGLSTLLTMFVGATGPFVIAVLRSFGFSPTSMVATSAAAMVIQHLLKVLVFGALGFAFSDYAWLILSMITAGFVGTLIGKKILMSLDPQKFLVGLNALLTVLAARLIYVGVSQM